MEIRDCRFQESQPSQLQSAKELFYTELMSLKSAISFMVDYGQMHNDVYKETMAKLDFTRKEAKESIAFHCLPREMAQKKGNELLEQAMMPAEHYLDKRIPGGIDL